MTVRTITKFWKLNKQIVRRPYPIPKISTTLQELEGFTYATALDLNMGYYTIRLDPQAVEMFTMGYAGSVDIFQAEMTDLMEPLEYVRAYIDNLLVIPRGTLEDHFEKLFWPSFRKIGKKKNETSKALSSFFFNLK